MKILLTCCTIEETHRIETDHDSHYPLGLAYLHSYLESLNKSYDIETRFLNNISLEKCMKTLKEDLATFKPDVVGISMMTHSRVGAYKLIKFIKKKYPHIKIVVGGMHVSIMYEQIAEAYKGIVCVVGEGEITLGDLLERWDNNLPIDDVKGIAYFDGKKVVVTTDRPLINDLDILPFPKHELFLWEGKTMAGLLTSRGCPYKCNFCVLDAASRRKVRCRSASNIADEVEHILANHSSVDTVWIHDDAFMIIKDRTIEFCNEIIKRGIKTNFVCSARFRPISREVVMLMKEAGFVHVLFGLESGSESVMKLMKKGLTQKAVRHGLKLFSETGIKATAFLIVGLPGETAETVEETIDFVQELQEIQYLFYDDIGVAGVYPGTELFTLAKEAKMKIKGYGIIDDKYWLSDGPVPFYEVDHKHEQLEEWKDKTRNAIAASRMFDSCENFLKQRKLLPSIIEYSWRWKFGLLDSMINILKQQPDLSFRFIKAAILNETPVLELASLHVEVEKSIIGGLLENIDITKKHEFMVEYKKQLLEDEKTLSRWHHIQEKEKSGIDSKNDNYAEEVVAADGTMITPIESDFDDERNRVRTRLAVVQ